MSDMRSEPTERELQKKRREDCLLANYAWLPCRLVQGYPGLFEENAAKVAYF